MPAAPLIADIVVNGKPIQGRRAGDQAGLAVRVRPRHRTAGVADRRRTGADQNRRPRREDVADAADPDQARGPTRATACWKAI